MKPSLSPILYKCFLKQNRFALKNNSSRSSSQLFPTAEDIFSNEFSAKEIPKQAQVVICGGGVVGTSVAYHLAKNFGWKDIVLLEQSW